MTGVASIHSRERHRIAVVGGGLAGLSAAWFLARAGAYVTLFEARQTLGGRLRSFTDDAAGMVVDTCQHLALGCCTEFLAFLKNLGLLQLVDRHRAIFFACEGGQVCRFAASPWLPPPLYLLPALGRLRMLTAAEKLALLRGAWRLATARVPIGQQPQESVDTFLRKHGQSENVIRRFWVPLLVSAASETLDRIPLRVARFVVREVFFRSRSGCELWIPNVPLRELCDRHIRRAIEKAGVQVYTGCAVKAIIPNQGRWHVCLAQNRQEVFDGVVLAVPWWTVSRLLPPTLKESLFGDRPPTSVGEDKFTAAAITGVHLWFDRSGFDVPYAVVPGRLAQWVFRPRFIAPKERQPQGTAHIRATGVDHPWWYCQVVISASHRLCVGSPGECLDSVLTELKACFPALRAARLMHSRIVTEPAAVLSVAPEACLRRPPQKTAEPGLALAGDWTDTGWPGTMESAVRSGRRAAEALLRDLRMTSAKEASRDI